MDSSPGFGSAALDWDRPIQTRFRFGSLYAKPRQAPATRWPVMQKVRRHNPKIAPTACRRMVSGTISLPLRGTFHLSLTVLVRYRSPLVFSLAGWSPRIQSGFHVSGFTQVPTRESHEFRLRASNPLRTDFPDCSATRAFCNSPAALWDDHVGPTTPNTQRPQAFTHSVWAVPLSLAATQGIETFFLFLRVLRCVISPGSLHPSYVFRRG